jgi:hypothetical protein
MRYALWAVLVLVPSLSHATDLTIKLISVDQARAGEIAFTAEIGNLNVTQATLSQVRIKPFLVPSADHPLGRDNLKGVVLPGANFDLDFTQGAATVSFRGQLPTVPSGDYLLGATVNLNDAINEADRTNNVTTDLLPVGQVSHVAQLPIDQPYDLYSDTFNMNVGDGRAYHSWRLFWRGGQPDDYDLVAAFFFVNLNEKKAYWGGYEKGVGLVSSGEDLDQYGNTVDYDRYSNSPNFSAVPSGKIHVMTWVNTRETYPELDSNNIDLALIHPKRVKLAQSTDSWFFFGPADAATQTRAVRLVSDYDSDGLYEIDRESIPAGVTISPMIGTLGDSISVTVDRASFSGGMNRFPIRIAAGGETQNVDFYVSLRTGAAPVVGLDLSLDFEIRKTEYSNSGQITLTNSSADAALVHLSSLSPSLFTGIDDGTVVIPARQTVAISVGADTRLLGVGTSTHQFRLLTGVQPQAINLNATVNTLSP